MSKKRQVVKTISCSVRQSKSFLKYFFVPKFLPFHCICVKIKSLLEIRINKILQRKLSVRGIFSSNNEGKFFVKNFCSWDNHVFFLKKTFAVGIIVKILQEKSFAIRAKTAKAAKISFANTFFL